MSTTRHTFHWRAGSSEGVEHDVEASEARLSEHLAEAAGDRASSAAALVREACEAMHAWLVTRAQDWSWSEAAAALERELADFRSAHGWRGPVANWLAVLRSMTDRGAARGHAPRLARELLAEELGLWLGGLDGEGDAHRPWNGEPLAPGRRMPDRELCARAFLDEIERGETILVHGYSDTVARALEALQVRGLAPEIVLSEGGAELGGRRMARRLITSGAKLRLIYDAALFAGVARADRIWVGTEAIGAAAFTARVGTRALLEEARRLEVPAAVLATSDKLVPGGELELPLWSERDTWLLWENAPEGVRLDSQAYEAVPLDLPGAFATELGRLSATELSLRCLRTEP